jgi:hypothetical protein
MEVVIRDHIDSKKEKEPKDPNHECKTYGFYSLKHHCITNTCCKYTSLDGGKTIRVTLPVVPKVKKKRYYYQMSIYTKIENFSDR